MNRFQCRNCGSSGASAKSHIIPAAFFRELRVDQEHPRLLSSMPGERPKKYPIGIYENILCPKCEAELSAIDSFGTTALLGKFSEYFSPVEMGSKLTCFKSESVDRKRLLQFLISVLWRASVSEHDFFKHVRLGKFEEAARAITFATSVPEDFLVFDAVLSVWNDKADLGESRFPLLDPIKERWEGVNSYRIYFGKIVAYIKVDKQEFPSELRSISLISSSDVVLLARSFIESKDKKVVYSTALKSISRIGKK